LKDQSGHYERQPQGRGRKVEIHPCEKGGGRVLTFKLGKSGRGPWGGGREWFGGIRDLGGGDHGGRKTIVLIFGKLTLPSKADCGKKRIYDKKEM